MLGVAGCTKEGDNITYYRDMAGILDLYSIPPIIKTANETFLAPELNYIADLSDGDIVVASFSVNYDLEPSSEDYYTASQLSFMKLDQSYIIAGEGDSYNYTFPIEDAEPFDFIDNYLIFVFTHTAPTDLKFTYEMTYNYEEISDENNIPTVSIRAKKGGAGERPEQTFLYLYAFDMRSFLGNLPKDSDNNVKFNIEYKTGKNEDGTEIFQPWSNNPLKLPVK